MGFSRHNLVKTVLIFFVWMTKGLYLEVSGPAMIDLKLIYNTNYESITRSVAGRGVGGVLGAVTGGILVDKFENHLDLFLASFSTLNAACIYLVPSMGNINYVWFLYFIMGACGCILNIAATRLALDMWKENNKTVIQLIHMGFGMGALLAPLICSPYLAVVEVTKASEQGSQREYHVIKESHVHLAFTFIAVFTIVVSVPFFLFHFNSVRRSKYGYEQIEKVSKNPAENQKSLLEIINPATYARGNFAFGSVVFLLIFVYYFNCIGGEKIFATFVRTFSTDVFKLNKTEASYLNMAFWISFTVGRLIVSCIAPFFAIKTLILAQVTLHLGSMTALYCFATTSVQNLWILTILEGMVVSPLYGFGVSYGHSQIDVTGFCLMIITLSGSFGDLTYLWTAGKLYDSYGPTSVLTCAEVAAWCLFFCVIAFRVTGCWQEKPKQLPRVPTKSFL